MSFDTERNSKINVPLAQIWSLSRSRRSPKSAALVIELRSYDSVSPFFFFFFFFCATDFYLSNGFRYWIFLLHGCWTNQINKPFFWYFLALLQFFCIFRMPIDTERNSEMDFRLAQMWNFSRSQKSPKASCICDFIKKLWLRSANLYFVRRIFIWRPEFASGFSFFAGC